MKVSYVRCDFCGGKKSPSTPMAQLSVPLSEDDKKLRKRLRGERSGGDDEPRRVMMHPIYGMFTSGDQEPTSTTFDMCMECANGILMARFREVRKMLALDDGTK